MIISSEKYKVEFFDQPEYVANQSDQIKNILNKFLDFFDIMKSVSYTHLRAHET